MRTGTSSIGTAILGIAITPNRQVLHDRREEICGPCTTHTHNSVNGVQYVTSSTRTRRGGSCLKDIYIRPFSSIELACAVRQPSPCVRALCESGVLFHMSHLKLHFALRTSHCSLHTPHCTLHTPPFTLHFSHCTLRSQHFTSHCTLKTPHCTLHTPHFTLHTALFALQTSHFTVHTSHFSLLTASFTLQTSHFTLHTALFTPHTSSHLSSSHLIPAQLFSSHPFSYVI